MNEQTSLQTMLEEIEKAWYIKPDPLIKDVPYPQSLSDDVNCTMGTPENVTSPMDVVMESEYMGKIQSLCSLMDWTLEKMNENCLRVYISQTLVIQDYWRFQNQGVKLKEIYDHLCEIADPLTLPDGMT